MWNKAANIQIWQYGSAQARRILSLSFAKVFMINKVPLHGELTSIVSGLKILCETMEQLTKGEKNILGYWRNTQCSLKLWNWSHVQK